MNSGGCGFSIVKRCPPFIIYRHSGKRSIFMNGKKAIKLDEPMPSYDQMMWALRVCAGYYRGEPIKHLGGVPPKRARLGTKKWKMVQNFGPMY